MRINDKFECGDCGYVSSELANTTVHKYEITLKTNIQKISGEVY